MYVFIYFADKKNMIIFTNSKIYKKLKKYLKKMERKEPYKCT